MFLEQSKQDHYNKVDYIVEVERLLRFSPQAWGGMDSGSGHITALFLWPGDPHPMTICTKIVLETCPTREHVDGD